MKRYLRSVRPLLDDENYERVVKQSQEFENGIAKKLQRYLVLKSWWSSNYVSDWWEEYVYLRGRSPLLVNSNIYGTDSIVLPTNNQTARAANITYYLLQFRRQIEREEIKPIMAQGLVPLCSWQYERMFNTVRVPGVEADKTIHYDDIKHMVVLHKGCYYKMMIYHSGRLLNASEIQYQLDLIIKRSEKSTHGEEYLASLTAWNRTKWANARNKFFADGVNKISLHEIETSAFLLILEDTPFEFDDNHPSNANYNYAAQCLHGKIYDRWFDKSFTLSFGTNGRVSFDFENLIVC
jgi:carnitine O-palmitoyltransferase 1, liver isoform